MGCQVPEDNLKRIVAYEVATRRAIRPGAQVSNVKLYDQTNPNRWVGLLVFRTRGEELPPDTITSEGFITLNATIEDYSPMMDILRGPGEVYIGLTPGGTAGEGYAYLKGGAPIRRST